MTLGNPLLRQRSTPVEVFDASLKELCRDLIDTMYFYRGVGIAGVQVGELKRIFIIEIEKITDGPMIFINPVIEKFSRDFFRMQEGCLSLPGFHYDTRRPRSVAVSFYDTDGQKHALSAADYFATAIQHEYDHLEGRVFLDTLTVSEFKKAGKKLAEAGMVYDLDFPARKNKPKKEKA